MSVVVRDYTNAAMKEAAGKVEAFVRDEFIDSAVELAKEKSPKLTGHNASTIDYEEQEEKNNAISWTIFTRSNYGGYLEVGTVKRPATPYFGPAITEALAAAKRFTG